MTSNVPDTDLTPKRIDPKEGKQANMREQSIH